MISKVSKTSWFTRFAQFASHVINTTTSIVTFLMVFVIQSTQNRDTAAMHIKVDEFIRVTDKARKALLCLEEFEESELEMLRRDYERLAAQGRPPMGAFESESTATRARSAA